MSKEEIIEIISVWVKNAEEKPLIMAISNNLLTEEVIKKCGGRNKNYILSATIIYIAYRKLKIPKTIYEISEKTDIEYNKITRTYKSIKNILGMKVCSDSSIMGKGCIYQPKAKDFVKKGVDSLKLPKEIEIEIYKLIELTEKSEAFQGKSPNNICGGCVYTACKLNYPFPIPQRIIADVYGVAESTIRDVFIRIKMEMKIKEVINGRTK